MEMAELLTKRFHLQSAAHIVQYMSNVSTTFDGCVFFLYVNRVVGKGYLMKRSAHYCGIMQPSFHFLIVFHEVSDLGRP